MDVSVTSLLKKPATYVLRPGSPRLKKQGGLAKDRREAMSKFDAGYFPLEAFGGFLSFLS